MLDLSISSLARKLHRFLTGGGQERDYRSTTENVAGIAAITAKALRLAMERLELFSNKTRSDEGSHPSSSSRLSRYFVFSGEEDFAPHILTFGIKEFVGKLSFML